MKRTTIKLSTVVLLLFSILLFSNGCGKNSETAPSIPETVKNPTFSIPGDTYSEEKTVEISCKTSGATIRFTTNGTTPSMTNGTIYTSAITVSNTQTIKAIAYKNGVMSSVVSAEYIIENSVANPTFSPNAGQVLTGAKISISCVTSGATIRYTTNGTDPSPTVGTIYSSEITISSNTTIKAIAYKTGIVSSIVTAAYSIPSAVSAVAVSPSSSEVYQGQEITMSSSTSGATIFYTKNGSTPTHNGSTPGSGTYVYNSSNKPVLSSSCTFKAIAYKSGYPDSTVTTKAFTSKQNEWTILVFMNGDSDDLTNCVQSDLNEMKAVNLDNTGINVIVLKDQYSYGDTRLYKVQHGSLKRLSCSTLGLSTTGSQELDMGNYQNLSKFINYGKSSFPAKKYAVIIWNHGDGWRSGRMIRGRKWKTISSPNTTPTTNTINSLTKISRSKVSTYKAVSGDYSSGTIMCNFQVALALSGKGISVVGFDACLMGMIETAYEIRNHADYMIASEESISGNGWDYTRLLNQFKASSKTPLNLVQCTVTSYSQYYASFTGATLSGIDLSKIDNLITAFDNFSTKLVNSITDNNIRNEIGSIIFNYAENYFDLNLNFKDYNVDLWDMAHQIQNRTNYADSKASALKTAIEQAVVAEWHNTNTGLAGNPRSHGIAIHFTRFKIDENGYMVTDGHNAAYFSNYSGSYPVAFATATSYSRADVSGLLYKIFYYSF